jgi:hypothetical protein
MGEVTTCPATRKMGFGSRHAALKRLRNWRGRGRTFHGQAVYLCAHCARWHITSQVPS